MDEYDKTPLSGYEIIFYRVETGFDLFKNEQEFAVVKTDMDGKFNFQFDADKDYMYRLRLNPNPLYHAGDLIINKGKKNNIDILAKRFGILKLRVLNEPPADTAKTFYVSGMGGTKENYFLQDTTVYQSGVISQGIKITYRIKTAEKLVEGEEQIKLSFFDTTEFTLRF